MSSEDHDSETPPESANPEGQAPRGKPDQGAFAEAQASAAAGVDADAAAAAPMDGVGAPARRRRGQAMVEMLPTAVTLGNLFSGFLAIAYLTDSLGADITTHAERMLLYERAVLLIFIAMICDALDGMVARLTRSVSAFGAQVDSICDAISFGAAPALLFKVVCESPADGIAGKTAMTLATVFLSCAVLRLARFNLETGDDEESHRSFEGLPTPAAAAVVAALVHVHVALDTGDGDTFVQWLLPICMPLLGALMVSRVRYLHAAIWLRQRRSIQALAAATFFVGFVVLYHEWMLPVLCLGFALSGPVLTAVRSIRARRLDGPIF